MIIASVGIGGLDQAFETFVTDCAALTGVAARWKGINLLSAPTPYRT
jgi:hypothetical protein